MFIFQKLPFYAKYGAIPESYLIALSYEEQLLWLCKHIEDLDEKLERTFLNLQNYINNGLASKQDKLIAGDNITIIDNIISADMGDDITSQMINGYEYQNFDVGEILPENPVAVMNGKCINLGNHHLGDKVKLHGKYLYYEVDSDTYEILVRESGYTDEENEYQTIEITTNGNVLITFQNTETFPCSLIYYYNYGNAIRNLQTNKQDKLIAGDNITIVNNVISATGGSGGVQVTKLESTLNLVDTSSVMGIAEGFYDTNSYQIEIVDTPHNVVAFGFQEIVYFDSINLVFIGSTKSVGWNYSNQAWEVTDNREITNIKAQMLQVTYLDSDITLTNGVEPLYVKGWYYLNNHNIKLSNGGHSTSVFTGKDIVYYDDTLKAFTNGIRTIYYDSNTWSIQMLQGIVNTLNTNQDNIPTCYAVSQALSNISAIQNETTGTTSVVTKIWSGTQAEYDLLSSIDSTTLYFIKE